MSLIEWLLGQKGGRVEFPVECCVLLRIFRPELRAEIVPVLVENVVEDSDRMERHDSQGIRSRGA
jgi:hypothetical protein